jgi:ferredoxin-NADP reductase
MAGPDGEGLVEPAAALLAEAPLWNSEADEVLVCRAVRQETHDVKTFVLAAREPRRFAYRPGQFLTFTFEIGGKTIHRCYTIAAAPTRPHAVSITVKRTPGGPVSTWLHDNLRPGAAVTAAGPMGEFTCLDHPAGKYLFLSGGSGITPLMSMARTFHDLALPRDIVFVHNARTPADIIFRSELDIMARHASGLRFVPVCEVDHPAEAWGGFKGRLTRPLLELIAPDLREREIFVCGPSPYMAAIRGMLREIGFDMRRHHEESFTFDELSAPERAAAEAASAKRGAPAGRSFRVEFARTRRVIECPADMFVLEAARRAGLRLPSSCTKGLCGTCKSKLVSGTVDMKHAGGIRQREIDAGMALLCCSRPTSDLVVER